MTGRRLEVLPAAPFSRHRGRHCRHGSRSGSFTGWSALAPVAALSPAVESFTRPRTTPLAMFPLTSADYTNPLENR